MASNSTSKGLPQTQMMIDPAERPRYSSEQIQQYFKRIRLPEKYQQSPILKDPSAAITTEHGLPLVKALTRYHTTSIPFENLELHYSQHRTISLDMDVLYDKFVTKGLNYGRGGRCMENNGFFGTVLRSLGFDVRNCAGRVSRTMSPDKDTREKQGQTYDGWNHMLNLVRFDQQWYIVDVGMGAMGPNLPYPLKDGFETKSIAPRRIRLQKRTIAEHAAKSEEVATKLWCYDANYEGDGQDWRPVYCFTETEFLPQDYEMMSWFTSTHKRSFFTSSALCTKMLLSDDEETIVGDITLFGNLARKTVGGNRETPEEFKTEQERIRFLEETMKVRLTEEEQDGIQQSTGKVE